MITYRCKPMKKITIILFTIIIMTSGLQVKNGQIKYSLNSAVASTEVNFTTCKITAKEVLHSCLTNVKSDFNIANILCNRTPNRNECKLQNTKQSRENKRACRADYSIVMGLCKTLKN
jgi:hypothetical protein